MGRTREEIRSTVRKWTGIPVCVGIGPPTVLAKVASSIAKRHPEYGGVVDLSGPDADGHLKDRAKPPRGPLNIRRPSNLDHEHAFRPRGRQVRGASGVGQRRGGRSGRDQFGACGRRASHPSVPEWPQGRRPCARELTGAGLRT